MAAINLPPSLPKMVKTILQPDIHSTKLILTDTPFPVPASPDDDVLVRVFAAAPCKGELLWAKEYPDYIPADKLGVPCQELAGIVVTAPTDSEFSAGDEVFCRVDAARPGAGREYTIAKARELAHKPKTQSWIDAAATPLSALTAWQALFVQGTLDSAGIHTRAERDGDGDSRAAAARAHNAKQRVLITGAGGSVGSWAVQLAALAGAGSVVALCGGPEKAAAAKQLGAIEVVDYRQTSIREWATADATRRQVDLVLDCIGGQTLADCWVAVKEGGTLVSVSASPETVQPADTTNKKLAKSLFFIVDPYGKNLAEIAAIVDLGKAKPSVDSVWDMEDFEKAFEKLENGRTNGKIIIKISPEA